mmetsp:Transcript_98045/g.281723  ORF Transcript_98045/g.281723 Transcript_98045/m.281723 type:complete len:262 (-) Transcript_98045:766-1551(-)
MPTARNLRSPDWSLLTGSRTTLDVQPQARLPGSLARAPFRRPAPGSPRGGLSAGRTFSSRPSTRPRRSRTRRPRGPQAGLQAPVQRCHWAALWAWRGCARHTTAAARRKPASPVVSRGLPRSRRRSRRRMPTNPRMVTAAQRRPLARPPLARPPPAHRTTPRSRTSGTISRPGRTRSAPRRRRTVGRSGPRMIFCRSRYLGTKCISGCCRRSPSTLRCWSNSRKKRSLRRVASAAWDGGDACRMYLAWIESCGRIRIWSCS